MVLGATPYRRASALTAAPLAYAPTMSAAWPSSSAAGRPSVLPPASAAAAPSFVFSEIMSRWNSRTPASIVTNSLVYGSSAARPKPDQAPVAIRRCSPRRWRTSRIWMTSLVERNSRAASAMRMVSPTAASSSSQRNPNRLEAH